MHNPLTSQPCFSILTVLLTPMAALAVKLNPISELAP